MAAIKTHTINDICVNVERIPTWGGWFAWSTSPQYATVTGNGGTEQEALANISKEIVARQNGSEAKS